MPKIDQNMTINDQKSDLKLPQIRPLKDKKIQVIIMLRAKLKRFSTDLFINFANDITQNNYMFRVTLESIEMKDGV